MADNRHFEKLNMNNHHFCNHLTAFDKMWHGDASGTPTANQPLKLLNLKMENVRRLPS